jgi:hypothetical protein
MVDGCGRWRKYTPLAQVYCWSILLEQVSRLVPIIAAPPGA